MISTHTGLTQPNLAKPSPLKPGLQVPDESSPAQVIYTIVALGDKRLGWAVLEFALLG